MRFMRVISLSLLFVATTARGAGAQQRLTTWRATEVWRVDGTEGGEPFGDLRDMVVTKDNVLWALDFKDQSIRRYDGNGKPLGTIGRKGSGPGEMRNANGMVVRRDGTVWVNDPSNARLTVFGADGKFVRQTILPGAGFMYRWNAWIDRQTGDLIDQFIHQKAGQTSIQWRRVSDAGTLRDTFPVPSCSTPSTPNVINFTAETKGGGRMSGNYPFTTGGGLAADGSGATWCATSMSTQAVLVRISRQDTVAQTRVELQRSPVLKAERDSAIARAQQQIAKYAVNNFDESNIPTRKPAITSLHVDDDGRLWVEHYPSTLDRSSTFDVHDRTGQHLGRLVVPVKVNGYLSLQARGNDLWLITFDADDVASIVRYRISR